MQNCCSVSKSCLTLQNTMDCSIPGFCIPHHLPEFAQVHVHWIGDAIQASHPRLPSSPPVFNLSQHQDLFQRVSSSQTVAKVWSFSFSISPSNEYSRFISFRIDWFDLFAVQGTLKSLFQHHSLKATVLEHSSLWSSSHICNMTTGKTIDLTIGHLSAKWCLCFLTHRLGLS